MTQTSEQKICNTCGQSKPIERFTKVSSNSSGRGAKCKDCHNAYCRKDRAENPQKYLPRDKIHRTNYPARVRARCCLNHAVRDKKTFRLPCERCGADKNVEAHHEDYSKPLEVNWLCVTCHGHKHANWGRGEVNG